MATVELIGCYELLCRIAARHGWRISLEPDRLAVRTPVWSFGQAIADDNDRNGAAELLLGRLDDQGLLR